MSKMLFGEFQRDNWKVTKKKGTTLSTCKVPGTSVATLLVEEELDVDIFRFLAVYN